MRVRIELNFGFGFVWLGRRISSWLDKRRKKRMEKLLKLDFPTPDQRRELESLLSLVGGNKIVIGG
jgi:hypothetical protein